MRKSSKFALIAGAVVGVSAVTAHLMKKKAEKLRREELKNDEDAQQIKNAVNFITKVRKGEVQISDDRENGKVKKHGDEENS